MRTVFFIIALFFLWAQVAVTLHAADHGFEEHHHEGERCELAAFVKHSTTLDVPKAQSFEVPAAWEKAFHFTHKTYFYSAAHNTFSARDPPVFS